MTIKTCQDCGLTKSKKGLYCKSCGYKHRKRPIGLKYNIENVNSGWFKPNIRSGIKTEFRSGNIPWNKGIKIGPTSTQLVGYYTMHNWVRYHKGSASKHLCKCGNPARDWANISHRYRKDLNDYLPMCRSCHINYDKDFKGASYILLGDAK